MPQIRLHYDGWLILPASMRDTLDMQAGDQLEVQLAEGGLVLRRARRAGKAAASAVEAATAPEPAAVDSLLPAAKRGRGRPRKVETASTPDEPGLSAASSPARRKPGRPRKVVASQSFEPQPVPAPATELRRKVTPPVAAEDQLAARPARDEVVPVSEREPEERRPFRRVEIRKLAPRPRVGGGRKAVVAAE